MTNTADREEIEMISWTELGRPDLEDDYEQVTEEAHAWHDNLMFPPAASFLAEQITQAGSAMRATE